MRVVPLLVALAVAGALVGGCRKPEVATSPSAGRPRVPLARSAHGGERMTPPAGSGVEHLPPGAKPAMESSSPPPARTAPDVPSAQLPDDIPRYPGLKALGDATSGRDSPETVTTMQAFSTDAPLETVLNWYASHLGEGWRRTSVPSLGGGAPTTSFDRDMGDNAAMTVTIAAAGDGSRVTISRTRPAERG